MNPRQSSQAVHDRGDWLNRTEATERYPRGSMHQTKDERADYVSSCGPILHVTASGGRVRCEGASCRLCGISSNGEPA